MSEQIRCASHGFRPSETPVSSLRIRSRRRVTRTSGGDEEHRVRLQLLSPEFLHLQLELSVLHRVLLLVRRRRGTERRTGRGRQDGLPQAGIRDAVTNCSVLDLKFICKLQAIPNVRHNDGTHQRALYRYI